MTPRFAEAVDPIFLYMLTLMERINRGESPDRDEVREGIRRKFRDADAQTGTRQGWELAKYAMVCWIDDLLSAAPWEWREWWSGSTNSLEFEFFGTNERATKFYLQAKEAQQISRRDALEVFYVCVVLGFRGFYAAAHNQEEIAMFAHSLEVPTTIDEWAKHIGKSIKVTGWLPRIDESPRPLEGAPPLSGKFALLNATLVGFVLAASNIVVWYWYLFVHLPGQSN